MEKLYDKDAYLTEFSAIVTSCEKVGGEFCVILDKTAFFPTAGGQTCDGGTLGGQAVNHVEADGCAVKHFVNAPIDEGTEVFGKINREERLRKMKHHSAEHIVSGFVHSMFGFDNVGFNLNDKEVTMDYNGELTEEDVKRLEFAANDAVQRNVRITAEYPDPAELGKINYRSKLDLSENVRIVTIEGVDVCACCAPHVGRTGEIGMIKITDFMRHRGGVRMRMVCGADALRDYQNKQTEVEKISAMLSARQNEISAACERRLCEIGELKQKISELSRNMARIKAEQIPETCGNICIIEPNGDMNEMRNLASVCKERCGGVAGVFAGNDADGYDYVITSKTEDLRKISATVNRELDGRGGGRSDIIQGHVCAAAEKIRRFMDELR